MINKLECGGRRPFAGVRCLRIWEMQRRTPVIYFLNYFRGEGRR